MRTWSDDDRGWQHLEATLLAQPWTAVTVHRPGREPVDLLSLGECLLVHDAEVTPAERAALCRMGFVRSTLIGGPYWKWLPRSATRPRRLGARDITRTLEVFGTCRRQRQRKVPRVLRDVLGASPQDVVVRLERPDDQQQLAG